MNRRLLFVMRRPPYRGHMAREALDALLATAVFGQDVSVLFMDDGVFQLLPDQQGRRIGQKTLSSSLSALSLYDIEKVYVHAPSLSRRGLTLDQLILDQITETDAAETARLFAQQDQLLSF